MRSPTPLFIPGFPAFCTTGLTRHDAMIRVRAHVHNSLHCGPYNHPRRVTLHVTVTLPQDLPKSEGERDGHTQGQTIKTPHRPDDSQCSDIKFCLKINVIFSIKLPEVTGKNRKVEILEKHITLTSRDGQQLATMD